MSSLFVRVLIALACFLLAMAALPALIRIAGFSIDADVLIVIRVCLAGIALFYVLRGDRWFPRGT